MRHHRNDLVFSDFSVRDQGLVAGVAVLLARESTANEPLVASVRNVEPQAYLLLQNEAESRCSTTDQISRPWSKSKRPVFRRNLSRRVYAQVGWQCKQEA